MPSYTAGVGAACLALALTGISLLERPLRAEATENLLSNGDLSKGSGNSPDHWRSESWEQSPETSTYSWQHPEGGPGELEVSNLKPNDARWEQSLSLGEGWYRFEADVRVKDVGSQATGASISIMEDGLMSADLHGDSGWQRLGFYLKVGSRGADVELALRLGGYSSLNTGRVFFRNVVARKVVAPPAAAAQRFDLDEIRKASAPPPVGRPWTLGVAFASLVAIVIFGWFAYGPNFEEPPAAAEPKVEPKRRAPRR